MNIKKLLISVCLYKLYSAIFYTIVYLLSLNFYNVFYQSIMYCIHTQNFIEISN